MPVITFATSKGGAGKTTSAIILGSTLARTHTVNMLDTDPAKRLLTWGTLTDLPETITMVPGRPEKYMQEHIQKLSQSAAFTIIDTEGVRNRTNALILAESDLVIIPMGDDRQDADAAIEMVYEVKREGYNRERVIASRILFNRTEAVAKSRHARDLNEQIRAAVGSFETELNRRIAYSAVSAYGGSLWDLDPEEVSGLANAKAQAELLTKEVLDLLNWVDVIGGPAPKVDELKELHHGRI